MVSNSYKHLDSWKNSKSAFKQQLDRNKQELQNRFPPHWIDFVEIVRSINPSRIVDIGCGAGVYCFISEKLDIEYIGYDYSQNAIDVAKESWYGNFVCKSYQEVTSKDLNEGDFVVANAICDVLPNGDECLRHLLSLDADNLLVQRVRLTNKESYFTEYQAYDIMTYEFYHNGEQLHRDIIQSGYELKKINLYEDIFDLYIRKR